MIEGSPSIHSRACDWCELGLDVAKRASGGRRFIILVSRMCVGDAAGVWDPGTSVSSGSSGRGTTITQTTTAMTMTAASNKTEIAIQEWFNCSSQGSWLFCFHFSSWVRKEVFKIALPFSYLRQQSLATAVASELSMSAGASLLVGALVVASHTGCTIGLGHSVSPPSVSPFSLSVMPPTSKGHLLIVSHGCCHQGLSSGCLVVQLLQRAESVRGCLKADDLPVGLCIECQLLS